MTDRSVCVHGHFYQPPRENPWLEAIELQDSAAPYHDWNERITAECYGPNARSRILDGEGRIAAILDNYSRISFDVGPTLLAWMEQHAPDVYAAVLRADRASQERFSGHGSAMAQAYNHMILPLASVRDLRTQVLWGVRDFHHRFEREPEGMWLPETAVGTDALEALAAAGIRFTILAPHQARRVRPLGARRWTDVDDGSIDTTVPYLVRLPSGRELAAFFYDGEIAQAVAFGGLLASGGRFADRLLDGFGGAGDGPRLVHVATDGETYGHHHRHGDMALAYALDQVERDVTASLTNYGEHLDRSPPELEVEVVEGSSWSCAHGVERWRADCGCDTGRGWHQRWRRPLRESLDWLRDRVEPLYEDRAGKCFSDPWTARDDYVDVVVDRSPERIEAFLDRHAGRRLDEVERIEALKLLELQRHAMLMYTSCGWFFDDVSGIETVQVLQYAARVIQLAHQVGDERLEEPFLERISGAEGNVPGVGDGRRAYEQRVRPAMVDLTKVAAHYAATSLFAERTGDAIRGPEPLYRGRAEEPVRTYCYEVEPDDHHVLDAGRTRLAIGRLWVTSEITRERAHVSFGALHFGDHNLNAAARAFLGVEAYQEMVEDVADAFERADLPEVVRRFDRHFGSSPYSLRTLFRDEQRRVLDVILDTWLEEAEGVARQLHERQAPLIRFLADIRVPLPGPFRSMAETVVDRELLRWFASEACDPEAVRELLDETEAWGLELDVENLAFTLAATVSRVAVQVRHRPRSARLLERLGALVALAQSLPWDVDLAETQAAFYDVIVGPYRRLVERGDADAVARAERMRGIAERLSLLVP